MNVTKIVSQAGFDGGGGELLAIVARRPIADEPSGLQFLTDDKATMQLGYIKRERQHVVEPHAHLLNPRMVESTQEVIMVLAGELLATIYDSSGKRVSGVVLHPGDVILLVSGGHSFVFGAGCEVWYVKQGPYMGERDKVRFKR